MNTKQFIIGGFLGGFFAAFLVFSFFIANAAHYSGDKIQKDPESWLNPFYRCKAEKLVPVTSKTKGDAVTELQNCLRFLNQSSVLMDGTWDREMRKSVKWFYKHFLGKKSNGKKFDKVAIERMQELALVAEPFLQVEPETPVVEETSGEISEESSGDLKSEVERIIAESTNWKSDMQKMAKKEADLDLPDDWQKLGKKSELEGLENFYYTALNNIKGAKQKLENGDLEAAHRFGKSAEEARLIFDQDFDIFKEQIQRASDQAANAEESKRAEEESRKQMEAFKRQREQKLADLKKKLKPVCTDLDCMIAAGLECTPRNILLTTEEGGKGGSAKIQTRLALKGRKGNTCNFFIKTEKIDVVDTQTLDHSYVKEYQRLVGKEGLCPLDMNMVWEMDVDNDVSHTFVEIKKEIANGRFGGEGTDFSIGLFMHNFKVNHPECSGTYFE